jgi:hypothetical protein
MAYYSDMDSYPCDSFDQDVKEWSEDIGIPPWRIDPPVHQHHSFSESHTLNQASPYQLPGNLTPPDFYLMSQETSPPYYSLPPTLYDSSSSSSSRPSPPVDSPASSFLRTPELYHRDVLIPPLGMNSYALVPDYGMYATESCVAMQNIQRCADAHFEESIDDFGLYETAYEPQELVPAAPGEDESSSPSTYYHHHRQIPMANAETEQNNVGPYPKIEPEPEQKQPTVIRQSHRHRRVAGKQTPLLTTCSSKITKRSSTLRKATSSRNRTQNQRIKEEEDDDEEEEEEEEEEHSLRSPSRSFPCPLAPYGCTSSFSAKNEWKRHAATQHFRLGFWRCDLCPPQTKPLNSHKSNNTRKPHHLTATTTHNDFNRKDLFIQHVRRMHPDSIALAITTTLSKTNKRTTTSTRKRPSSKPSASTQTSLSHLAARCHRLAYSLPPPSLCVFCGDDFEGGAQGLESRLEHMGKHMDTRRKAGLEPVGVEEWKIDEGLQGWLLACGVLVREGGRLVVKEC